MILIIETPHQLDPGSDIAETPCARSLALGLQRMGFHCAEEVAERSVRDDAGRRLALRRARSVRLAARDDACER